MKNNLKAKATEYTHSSGAAVILTDKEGDYCGQVSFLSVKGKDRHEKLAALIAEAINSYQEEL